MTLGEVIDKLQELAEKYGRDINIDCNDMDGGYTRIQKIGYQCWLDRAKREHETITIYHDDYDSRDSLKKKEETLK